jgi:hypothetical protein
MSDGGSLLMLVVMLVGFWLIIYTAVRAAVGHALDRVNPCLVAEARTTQEGVDFVVTNTGTAPALDLFVRWSARPTGEALTYTPTLGLGGRLEWTIAAESVEDESQSVRKLELDWAAANGSGSRHSTTRAVLVPSRLDTAR